MTVPTRRILEPIFGYPILRAQNNGQAGWCKENSVSQWQKGSGWTANLYGGVQTGDDWAAIFIPVLDLPLIEFTQPTAWSYYMTAAETMGVNLVIWVHDPADYSKRAEITQLGNIAGLGKALGWNSHALSLTTDQFFFYGEGTTGSGLTAGASNLYGLDDFQADVIFKNWVIYRVSLEYGWDASGTFDDVWVAEAKFNGQALQIAPQYPTDYVGSEVKTVTYKTVGTSTTVGTMLTPRATKRIRILSVALGNLGATSTEIEVYFHTGANIDTTPAKAIFTGTADADYASSALTFGKDAGPLGAVGEVVSVRTSVDITTNGRVTITYREE